jgi:branched-chain amino acid transport system ATP-binding protein
VANTGTEVLNVQDVSVSFGKLAALESVSLSVETGEVVGVIGPNGAGKTTLFNAISGFVPLRSGRIVLDGREKQRIRPHQLSKLGVGRTLQGVGLWPGLTVLENVMAGAQVSARAGLASALLGGLRSSRDEDALERRAFAILQELDVDDLADRLPPTLPYATQKRIALARTLVSSPRLLLLDEPASGLSDAELASLGDLLRRLKSRMGIVLVEHHMDLVMSVCDRVVVLDVGCVIATGTPDEVKEDPAVTDAYLGQAIAEDPADRSLAKATDADD